MVRSIEKHNIIYTIKRAVIITALNVYNFHFKKGALFLDEAKTEKTIADQTLVVLTIMIAESQSAEKEMMMNVIMNCIGK